MLIKFSKDKEKDGETISKQFNFFQTYPYKNMRTTKQLSKSLVEIQDEAITRILSFFNRKSYIRIVVDATQNLNIRVDDKRVRINDICKEGTVQGTYLAGYGLGDKWELSELSIYALLTILDELERMKKHNQLKKS